VIGDRIKKRSKHFMPPALLPSQFAILEPLGPDEDGVVVPVAGSPDDVVDEALRRLGLAASATPIVVPASADHAPDSPTTTQQIEE